MSKVMPLPEDDQGRAGELAASSNAARSGGSVNSM
jgi:hypothetical protein